MMLVVELAVLLIGSPLLAFAIIVAVDLISSW